MSPERRNHPDVPVSQNDDEDYLDYVTRLGDWFDSWTPAAPAGFELVHCPAEPRHPAVYMPVVAEFYEPPCMYCAYDGIKTYPDLYRHLTKHHHRRWRHVVRLLDRLGLIKNRGWSMGSYAGCDGCLSWRWRWARPVVSGTGETQ